MGDSLSISEDLLRLAAEGVPSAQSELLECYRQRLRRMVALRLDRRMATRVDPSDVVQEALHCAHQRLNEYFTDRSTSFYPWLRGIAWDRLVDLYRMHMGADKRTVLKEQPCVWPNDGAIDELAHSFADNSAENPRRHAMLAEVQQRVRAALLEMNTLDREVLSLRYLEHLSVQEIAEVKSVTPSVVTTRHIRALKRLRERLGPSFEF